MQDGFMNIIVILGIIVGVLFFYSRSVQLKMYTTEGMTTTRKRGDPEPTSDMADNVNNLEIQLDKLKTSVSIDANRKNYESIIINFEDIISYSMMKRLSEIDPNGKFSDISADFSELNEMQNAKKTLNDMMAWLDKK